MGVSGIIQVNIYFQRWVLGVCVLWLSGVGVQAQNSVRWTTNYYLITGTTLPEMRQSIHQNRPWKEKLEHDAMTEWRVDWQFKLTAATNGCRCSGFGTKTSIVMTMPLWVAPTNAPDAVHKIWAQYVGALGRHEAGHAELALAAAAEIRKRVEALGGGGGCDGLKMRINDLSQQVIDEHRKGEKAYDAKTRHGATQGAIMPGRVRRER